MLTLTLDVRTEGEERGVLLRTVRYCILLTIIIALHLAIASRRHVHVSEQPLPPPQTMRLPPPPPKLCRLPPPPPKLCWLPPPPPKLCGFPQKLAEFPPPKKLPLP